MTTVFVAYASGNDFHGTVIRESAEQESTPQRSIVPWSENDTSGQQIARSVESWIEEADAFIGDISVVNMNVTYEVGYAIGLKKPVRLIRSSHTDFKKIKAIGLLDTLGHDTYDFHAKLRGILKKPDVTPRWQPAARNKSQPIFILQPPSPTDVSRATISAVKKTARYKFRAFNPAEISRLNASEAFELASASFGIVAFWLEGNNADVVRNNQRAAFIFGLGRGMDIPSILLAHESSSLPLDLHDYATRWGRMDDIDSVVADFRNRVADEIVQHIDDEAIAGDSTLSNITFGDPIAENEQDQLAQFFLQTDSFVRALSGQAHVLVGRKGSGKSAIFFQVRDRTRANKNNIVVDLMPEGFQLIKLKEFILDKLSFGTRKEVVAAFWEYIIWLEIAYKILEKDRQRAAYDAQVLAKYQKLEELFFKRVDTGAGDFSERLGLLSDNIIKRFSESGSAAEGIETLKSSQVLEIIYGEDLSLLRDVVLDYLKLKGFVLFLFDNLDRIWTPGGFNQEDALILVGLSEAMQEISRKFSKSHHEYRWVLFIRSDVYEFLIAGMADYGKLSTESIEWSDRDQLRALFNHRLIAIEGSRERAVSIEEVSQTVIDGKPVMDFLIDGSMMRPRYLIRLFETARRRALTLGRGKISEDDYSFALKELGWQALEDLDREIVDLVAQGQDLLFEILEHRDGLTAEKLRYIAARQIQDAADIQRLIDVMVWNGSLGVTTNSGDKYIFDTGYKRKFIASLIKANKDVPVVIHPTSPPLCCKSS